MTNGFPCDSNPRLVSYSIGELLPQVSAVWTVNSSGVPVGIKATGIFSSDAVATRLCVGKKLLGVSSLLLLIEAELRGDAIERFGFLG